MARHTNNITLRSSAALTGAAGTTTGSAVRVDGYDELNVFFRVTAQGTWNDEYLTVSIQTKDPDGNWYDLANASFAQIGDKTGEGDLPYGEHIAIVAFGSNIRLKYVTAGTTPNYTFQVTAIGKGDF